MSSIVADELAKIKSFETDTEKRRSELTLNELNYISDKQLHKKDGGGSGPVEWDMLGLVVAGSDDPPELLAGDYSKLREKLENAISTGTIDEPIYIGLLWQTEGGESPLYCSIEILLKIPEPLVDNAILFTNREFSFDLMFKSDNTFEWDEEPINH